MSLLASLVGARGDDFVPSLHPPVGAHYCVGLPHTACIQSCTCTMDQRCFGCNSLLGGRLASETKQRSCCCHVKGVTAQAGASRGLCAAGARCTSAAAAGTWRSAPPSADRASRCPARTSWARVRRGRRRMPARTCFSTTEMALPILFCIAFVFQVTYPSNFRETCRSHLFSLLAYSNAFEGQRMYFFPCNACKMGSDCHMLRRRCRGR